MSFRIRPGNPADAEALTALRFACQAETYGPLYGADFVAAIQSGTGAADEDREHLRSTGSNVQVAENDDDGLVGFAITADGPMDWEAHVAPDVIATRQLVSLYTLASTHGTGLGAQLLEAALTDHDPAEPVYLWIMAGNDRADAFYRKHGFTQVDNPPWPAEHAWSGQFTYRMIRPGAPH